MIDHLKFARFKLFVLGPLDRKGVKVVRVEHILFLLLMHSFLVVSIRLQIRRKFGSRGGGGGRIFSDFPFCEILLYIIQLILGSRSQSQGGDQRHGMPSTWLRMSAALSLSLVMDD